MTFDLDQVARGHIQGVTVTDLAPYRAQLTAYLAGHPEETDGADAILAHPTFYNVTLPHFARWLRDNGQPAAPTPEGPAIPDGAITDPADPRALAAIIAASQYADDVGHCPEWDRIAADAGAPTRSQLRERGLMKRGTRVTLQIRVTLDLPDEEFTNRDYDGALRRLQAKTIRDTVKTMRADTLKRDVIVHRWDPLP